MTLSRIVLFTLILFPVLVSAESSMYISPEEGRYVPGEVFQVRVLIDADESINAAEAELSFDTSVLKVIAISSGGSLLTTWPSPPSYSNGDGIVSFSGWGAPFQGKSGQLVTVTFQALRPLQSSVQLSSSAALAVGQGSNVITTLKSGHYSITTGVEEFAPTSVESLVEEDASSTQATTSDTTTQTNVAEGGELPETPAYVRITSYEPELTVGERSVIRGSATPRSRVWMWTEHGTNKPVRTEVMSDSDGSFTFRSRQLEEGVYRFHAEVYGNGVSIKPSETIKVTVEPNTLTAAASTGGSLLTSIILGGAGVGFFALLFGYWRFWREKKKQEVQMGA